MTTKKKRALDFKVYPLWKFLQETYGLEQAFRIFSPYRGAEIQPTILNKNTVEVTMPLVPSNTNYVGTQFGGSLYSMCDPFFMFLLIWNLGEDYMVWDKSAKIEFVKPGRGTVKARFHIPEEEILEIKVLVEKEKKTTRFYKAEVIDHDGTLVAQLEKGIYIRKISK